MSAPNNPLARAFEGPHDRAAEAAVARWLMAPNLDALVYDLHRMPLTQVREVGATLEAYLLTNPLSPPEVARALRMAEERASPHDMPGQTVQKRWGVRRLPFEPARLRQRLKEAAALTSEK